MELKTNKTIKNFTLLTICAVALLQPVLTGAMEKNEAVALINKFDKEIDDRLCTAAKAGNIEGVKAAIKDAADVNAKGIDDGMTPLLWACKDNNLEMAKYLVEKGANVNAKDNDGWTPLHWTNNLEMVKYLVEKGANVNAKDNDGETPLHWACEKNNLAMVTYLVGKGANVNAAIKEGIWKGVTPLHWPSFNNNLEMVKYLVEKGANVNAKDDDDGWTPLHWACVKNNLEMVKYLVGKGADVNAKKKNGWTPRDDATDLQVRAYLEMAEDFYQVNAKTMTFDAFTQKHLVNNDSLIQERNRTDTHNLLHFGTKAFFDAFVGLAEQHKQLNFGDGGNGAKKEFLLLDCATRQGPHRDAWFKECFAFLNREYSFENVSEFEEALEKELAKLPATERDMLTKEKNKIVQQKKTLLAIPKHLRMPTVGKISFVKVGGFGDKVKKKLIDVKIGF